MYLYTKERDFVERLIALHGEDYVLREYDGFQFTSRFIDDRLSNLPEGKLPSAADYDGLELACAGSGRDVNYLGVRYQADSTTHSVRFTINDKQKYFPCNLVRFPSMVTNVPTHVRVGTVVTMLVRTWRYSSRTEDFFTELRRLMYLFMKKGYPEQLLKLGVSKFVDRNVKSEYRAEMRHRIRKVITVSAGDHAARAMDPTPVVVNNRIRLGVFEARRLASEEAAKEEKSVSQNLTGDSFIDEDPFLNPNRSPRNVRAATPETQELLDSLRDIGTTHNKDVEERKKSLCAVAVQTSPSENDVVPVSHAIAEILNDQRHMVSALMQELREQRNVERNDGRSRDVSDAVIPAAFCEEALQQQRWAFESIMRHMMSLMSERISAIDDRIRDESRQPIADLVNLLRDSNAATERNLLRIEERSSLLERNLLQLEDRSRESVTLTLRDFSAGILQVVNRLAERPTIDLTPIATAFASIGPHLSALAASNDRHFDALAISIRDGVTVGVANGFIAGSTTLANRLVDSVPAFSQIVTQSFQSLERLLMRQHVVVNQSLIQQNALVVAGLPVASRREQAATSRVEEIEDVGSANKHTAGAKRSAKRHRSEQHPDSVEEEEEGKEDDA